jgi:hypothetical protein
MTGPFLAYFTYFEKIKVGLWDHLAVCVFVNPPTINFWMPEPTIAPEPVWTAYFVNVSH